MPHRTTHRLTLRVCVLAALAAALAACQATAPPAAQREHLGRYPRVTTQGNLNKILAYDKPRVHDPRHGPMSVTVPVRVLRDRPVRVQYRFVFLDSDGQPTRPRMGWRYKALPGRVQRFLSGTALDADASDWRLELRTAR